MSINIMNTGKALALASVMALGSYSVSAQNLGLGNTEGDSGWLNPSAMASASPMASRGNLDSYSGYQEGAQVQPQDGRTLRGQGANPRPAQADQADYAQRHYQEGETRQPHGGTAIR